MGEKEEKIDKHDTIISAPLHIFSSKPFNHTFIEKRIDEIFATPKDQYSDVFTFTRPGNNVGLLKTTDASISCRLSVRSAANALVAAGEVHPPPLPLRCMFKSKETKINEVLVTPSSNDGHYQSYVSSLTRELPEGYKDSKEINLFYLDTPAHMDTFNQVGSNSLIRRNLCRVDRMIYDIVDTTCFNESEDIWVPSALKIEIKYVRAANQVVLMGQDHADLAIADAKISMEDLKITIPVFKPRDQLTNALNKMFVEEDRDAKYYTTVFRTVNTIVPAGRRKIQENDVFNGSLPVRMFIMFSPRDNYNGTYATNCFNFPWQNYSDVSVSVNSQVVGEAITSPQQAYKQLRRVLNRDYAEMPFTYSAFNNGYAILAFDLSINEDTHLAVLPSRSSGVLNYTINFSQNTAAGTIICIGEFRNEIKVGLKKPARLLFDI